GYPCAFDRPLRHAGAGARQTGAFHSIFSARPGARVHRDARAVPLGSVMTNRWFTRIFGTRFNRELKRIQPIVDTILEHEVRLKDLADSELQAQTAKFRDAIAQRTGEVHAEVERLKKAKHDCPDPEERANLSEQLRK